MGPGRDVSRQRVGSKDSTPVTGRRWRTPASVALAGTGVAATIAGRGVRVSTVFGTAQKVVVAQPGGRARRRWRGAKGGAVVGGRRWWRRRSGQAKVGGAGHVDGHWVVQDLQREALCNVRLGAGEHSVLLREVEVGGPGNRFLVGRPSRQPKDGHVGATASLGGELVNHTEGSEQGHSGGHVLAVVGDAGDFQVNLETERDRLGAIQTAPRMHDEAEPRPASDARGHAGTVVHALESDQELRRAVPMDREHVGGDVKTLADEARDVDAGDTSATTSNGGDQGALEGSLGSLKVGEAREKTHRAGGERGDRT